MSRVVAIGAPVELLGYELVGVDVVEAAEPDYVRAAWASVGPDVGLVVLTQAARAALPETLPRENPLWVVLSR
jgi:vacuolar-type H+-ATPase subunit F/Vma7